MAIAWAQGTKARTSSGLSQTTTGIATQAAGSTFIIAAQWSRNSGTFSSVADSKGNVYTLIDTQLDWDGVNGGMRLYFCENGIGGASHTATFTLTGSNGPITLFFGEITGGLTSGILDQHTRREDTATPFTLAAALTTVQPDELLVAFFAGNSGNNPATHGESGLGSSTIQATTEETDGTSFWTGAVATAVKSATGAFNPSWTETGGASGAVFLATFKAATTPSAATANRGFHPGRSPGYAPQAARFFQPPQSYAVAAQSSPIAGTGGITFGQSGTLTGAGALAGTNGFTFGQSGALAGAGALAGTASISFGQTGTLTGAGALAGISALTFGQSGALTGAGSLSATIALTFGQSGALTGAGALAGTAPLTFAASATADLPLGALAGTGAITFAASGTLAASGALSGTTPIVFGASATADQAASQSGQTPAGGFAGRRRRRMFIEIDGQTFEVESAEHAQALLDQAKALARQAAPQKAEANLIVHLGTRPRERPKIERPHIVTFSPELHEIVRKARTVITDTYKAAYRDAEIRLRMGEKVSEDDADDDDFLMML